VKPPLHVAAASRAERQAAVLKAAQVYADSLFDTVRAHPYEWYHFEPFLSAPLHGRHGGP
jgi:predicted LPLAT superfamily acyltransferase